MMNLGYWTMCVAGHCYRIPELVDAEYFIKKPGPIPQNFPELELAMTVLSLIEHIDPMVRDKEFTKKLSNVAMDCIEKARRDLPAGVELVHRNAAGKKAAA